MASTARLAPAVDCDECPSGQKKKSADGSDRPERVWSAQRECVERSGKQQRPTDPTGRCRRDQRAQATGWSSAPRRQGDQGNGVDKMIEHSSLPQTCRLELDQGLLQCMGTECAQHHTDRSDYPGEEEKSVR